MRWLIVLKFVLLLSCSFKSVAVTPTAIDTQLSVKSEDASSLFTQSRKFSKGEALYIQNCADCHGWEGRGSGQAARYLDVPTPILLNNELLTEKSEKQFVDWVLSGKALTLQLKENSMLQTDTEVNALLAHIKKLPSIKWNEIEAGQETYDALCINCHGLYGHGDGSLASKMPGPLPDLNSPDFQTRRSDEELLKIITKGKDAMPGAENVLTPKEIKNLYELKSGNWSPKEATSIDQKQITLLEAIRKSRNRPVIQLAQSLGFEQVEAGLSKYIKGLKTPLKEYPAQLIGAVELSLRDVFDLFSK